MKNNRPHPWDKWFESDHFRLVRGKDYKCLTHCMSVQLRNKAKARGYGISIRSQAYSLIVTLDRKGQA